MAFYLLQAAYTTEKWKTMVAEARCTEPRTVRPVIQKLGGKVISGFMAFGEYDVVEVYEIPDNVGAGAISAALASTGIFKAIKTTPLMMSEDFDQGLKKANEAGYGKAP